MTDFVEELPEAVREAHFYRDPDFPGKRGPYQARVLVVYPQQKGPMLVDVQVTGEGGGVFSEFRIPYLTGQFEDPGTRYATQGH
jgi:hypothetical protein